MASGLTKYTVTANDKIIDSSLVTASAATFDITAAKNGLVITNYKPTFKLTGISAEDIYKISPSEGTITLQLAKGTKTITLKTTSNSNKLILSGTTYYVGENAFYNASVNASRVTLTSGATEFTAIENDYVTATGTVSIDGSRTAGVTLVGGANGNTLVGSSKSDTFTGADDFKDVFVYSGGNDLIVNYTEGLDIISLTSAAVDEEEETEEEVVVEEDVTEEDNEDSYADVPINFATFECDSDGNIKIKSDNPNNSLTIDNANAVALKFSWTNKSSVVTETRAFSSDGQLDGTKTDITLSSGHGDFNLPNSTVTGFANIASIHAYAASTGAVITANTTIPSYINAGDQSITMVGGSGDDTLRSGTGNSSLVGGKGANIFIIGGGNDTVANYKSTDKI